MLQGSPEPIPSSAPPPHAPASALHVCQRVWGLAAAAGQCARGGGTHCYQPDTLQRHAGPCPARPNAQIHCIGGLCMLPDTLHCQLRRAPALAQRPTRTSLPRAQQLPLCVWQASRSNVASLVL